MYILGIHTGHHDASACLFRDYELVAAVSLERRLKWPACMLAKSTRSSIKRAMRWPDAFPRGDIAVLNNLGGVTVKQAEEMSQAWRPWRSYAVLHIWHNPLVKAVKAKKAAA